MTYPVIKTAQALVLEGILPCSQATVRMLAKRHGIGRILGRTYVFTAEDIERLLERLPRPGEREGRVRQPVEPHISSERAFEKAMALTAQARAAKRAPGGRR